MTRFSGKSFASLLALFLALIVALPAQALVPGVLPSPTAPTPTAEATISAEPDTTADAKIAERIRGIFGELPQLADVDVSVSKGVVTLSGKVADTEDRARAAAIAERVSGVATVENRIERDTSVGGATKGVKQVTQKFADFAALLPLFGAALIVWLAIGLVGYLIAGLGGLWHRVAPNSFLAELLSSAVRFIFVVFGLVVALNMLGAGALMGAVLGGAGVAGIALGFAMRDTIENYVASLMLSLRQPFRPNDWVVIDDHEGRVIRLTSRATVLMTLDGNHLRVPNSAVFKAVILNYTRNPQRRFDFVLGIDADDDPTAARRVGREALAALDFVLADPAPEARLEQLGASNIEIRYLGWIDQREADWFKARSSAIAAVKATLEEAGFAIPEPIYRLRFDPRTTPLPLENVAERAPQAGAPPQPAKAPAETGESEDVTPQNEIAEMVDREREEASGSQEKDLLDTKRPVE
jgi:small-conductance mechanosensitive channel